MHKARSFIATLHAGESPINVLGCMTEGPVVVSDPAFGLYNVDGTHALAVLNGSDSDWQHGQEFGLITFSKGEDIPPLKLYFRSTETGYCVYVRSGEHVGWGVYGAADGQVKVQAIADQDPTGWRIVDAKAGAEFDPTQSDVNELDVLLTSSQGHPMGMYQLYPVGGYLSYHQKAKPIPLRLRIEERDVDWLSAE